MGHAPLTVRLCRLAVLAAILGAILASASVADAASGFTSAPQGGWVGSYGASGYSLGAWNGSSDLTSIPGGSVSLVSGSRWVWAHSTSDTRALQSPAGSGRDAATWYDPNQLSLTLTLQNAFSGNLHLYAVDWDSKGRRETITVTDPAGPQTVALNSDFSQGAWSTFAISVPAGGSVTITVTDNAGPNAVLSGIFLGDAGAPPSQCAAQPQVVSAPIFPIGVWQQPPSSFARWSARGVNTIVDDMNLQTSESFSSWEQQLACQNLFAIRGPQQSLAQENTDARLLALSQGPFQEGSGNWVDEPDVAGVSSSSLQSTYQQYKAGAPSKPVFETLSGFNLYQPRNDQLLGSRYQWATSTSDPRALESPDGSSREASTYYANHQLQVVLSFSSAFTGNLHLYVLDWDRGGRRETITVTQGTTTQTADLSSDFSNGVWVGFGIDVPAGGTLTITVANTAGPNAVLGGIFLDQAASPLSRPTEDTSTQGNWLGVYGSAGYDLAAWNGASDLVSIPGVQLTLEPLYNGWLSAADWIGEDIYPISGYGDSNWVDLSLTAQPPVGYVEHEISQWTGGKPVYSFIEAAGPTNDAPYRAPTADEFRGEVWDAIINGAQGIVYTPQADGYDDASTAAIDSQMTSIDQTITQIAPMLLAPGAQQAAPAPFEVATHSYCGTTYTLTLNFSHQTASYQGTTYGPYQLEISPTPPDPLPSC
jgi:hypothetical protein